MHPRATISTNRTFVGLGIMALVVAVMMYTTLGI